MSSLKEYTLEIYKADRRVKSGRRLIEKRDFEPVTKDYIDSVAKKLASKKITVEVYETYVTRRNMMGGAEYQERYDTPHYCSPSSESYWSM